MMTELIPMHAFNFFVIGNNSKNLFSFLHFFFAEMVFDENAPQIDSIESVEEDAIINDMIGEKLIY